MMDRLLLIEMDGWMDGLTEGLLHVLDVMTPLAASIGKARPWLLIAVVGKVQKGAKGRNDGLRGFGKLGRTATRIPPIAS